VSQSKIEWTDATWNPYIGCTRVSEACENCYAAREEDTRFRKRCRCLTAEEKNGLGGNLWDKAAPYFLRGPVYQGDDVLQKPLHWTKPRRVFVGSRTDLFHPAIPFEQIDRMFAVMALTPHHTYQVLTKRPGRMKEYFDEDDQGERADNRGAAVVEYGYTGWLEELPWPLPNVWLGVTAENQARADERIPPLLECPAAVRYVSVEPMLGEVNLRHIAGPTHHGPNGEKYTCVQDALRRPRPTPKGCAVLVPAVPGLDWVICGGETARPRANARPMHPDWPRVLRNQCAAAGAAFFFKQWGEWLPQEHVTTEVRDAIPENVRRRLWADETYHEWEPGRCSFLVGKKRAGRLLDGRLHDEMPIRQGPGTRDLGPGLAATNPKVKTGESE